MTGILEKLENLRQFTDGLRLSIQNARAEVDGGRIEDEVILEKINESLSQVGFLAIRKPRSNASSGTDPWDR